MKKSSQYKKTWQILRKAINKSTFKDNSISNILVDNSVISDPKLIADNFNHFFLILLPV